MMKFKTIFLFSIFLFLLFFVKKNILAQTFDSASFHIDFGNFNMTAGKKSSTNYTLTDTVGQNAPGRFDNTGYVIKSGFQYLYDEVIPLSFKISNLELNFGSLVPSIGSTLSNTLTISTPTGHGYDILAIASHPLATLGANYTIPDTKCDASDCTSSTSGAWTSNSTYGFGFNANGNGTSPYFTNTNYFRCFANNSSGESAKVIMSENTPVKNHSAVITYKINIPPTQSAGTYQNSINFIAVPKY
jgi:hypothetical protein